MAVSRLAGAVEGMPRLLLRLEGAALAVAAVYMYHRIGGNWWLFAALILVPDVSFAAYFGTRLGRDRLQHLPRDAGAAHLRGARLPAALVRSVVRSR